MALHDAGHSTNPPSQPQAIGGALGVTYAHIRLERVLLDEERHRLGNLLQLAVTNLDRRSRLFPNSPCQAAIDRAARQLQAMARLHVACTDAGARERGNCAGFLSELCANLENLVLEPRGIDCA